jgi:Fe2+ or Zn2+ uptake regulation protein
MPIHEEAVFHILSEATEPLFASEIAERLNLQVRPATAYRTIEVGRVLQRLHEQAVLLADGRWVLKP